MDFKVSSLLSLSLSHQKYFTSHDHDDDDDDDDLLKFLNSQF